MSRTPSVWFKFKDNFSGDIIHQSVCIPEDGATVDTYYCCLEWNAGMLGGGYCGIQDTKDGRNVIYSLWDPPQAKTPISAVYVGEGTTISHFGGEGTGLHALNYINWQSGGWYTLVTRVWPYKDSTYYALWVKDEGKQTWRHIVTMDFPYTKPQFDTSTGCFVEDFVGTGDNERKALYRYGYKRQPKGWYPFSVGTFNVVTEPPSHLHAHNYDAGTDEESFYLASGGTIKPSPGIGTTHTFYLSMPSQPQEKPIQFSITRATTSGVVWTVPDSSTPQFRFTVTMEGHQPITDIQPEVRGQALTGCKPGDVVTVTIEDILGRSMSLSQKISQNYMCCAVENVCSCSIS